MQLLCLRLDVNFPSSINPSDLRRLNVNDCQRLLQRLGQCFYEVVPLSFRTYCSLTARVVQRVLSHYGLDATLLLCQLWCIMPDGNYVVGFVEGVGEVHSKWNGHVVCVCGDSFIDAAVFQLKRDFSLAEPVPNVVVGKRFGISSHAISRVDLGEQAHLFWLAAPQGWAHTLPEDPAQMIECFASNLIAHLESASDLMT